MVKYCTYCGKPNEDQASFCTACGQPFPAQASTGATATQVPASGPPPSTFTIEMGTGAHKHMITDFYLKDASGKTVLAARKTSMLHQDYTVVDGNEAVSGSIEVKAHLSHTAYNLLDANHALQVSVQVGNLRQRGTPPNCSFEDAKGNKLGTIQYANGFLAFSGIKSDGSRAFDATFSATTGAGNRLEEFTNRSYSVTLLDQGFPLPTLLTIFMAVDRP